MLRNPDPMPSACYLPSHPPGKLRARQTHCAQMLPRRQEGRLCRVLVAGAVPLRVGDAEAMTWVRWAAASSSFRGK